MSKPCHSTSPCPLFAQPSHDSSDCLHNYVHVPIVVARIMFFYRSCPSYKLESELPVFRYKVDLTLREAKHESHRRGFSISPYSNTIHCSPLSRQSLHLQQYLFPPPSHLYLYLSVKLFFNSKSRYSNVYNFHYTCYFSTLPIVQDKLNVPPHLHLPRPHLQLHFLLECPLTLHLLIKNPSFHKPPHPTSIQKPLSTSKTS